VRDGAVGAAASAARWPGGKQWPAAREGAAADARPAALAAILSTLPSAVRRNCAAALDLAKQEAGVLDPRVARLELALGFAGKPQR